MGLAMRQVDLERLDRALTTLLSPLAHQRCDDWCRAVESSVAELLDGDHVVFGLPRAGVPMYVHSMNVAATPQRAIQTLFGQLPDLPPDPWLQNAERERLRSGVEVWSRLRAFWRAAAGQPAALTALGLPRRGPHARTNLRQREHRLAGRGRTHRAVHLVQQRRDIRSFATDEPTTHGGSTAPAASSGAQGGSHHAPRA